MSKSNIKEGDIIVITWLPECKIAVEHPCVGLKGEVITASSEFLDVAFQGNEISKISRKRCKFDYIKE